MLTQSTFEDFFHPMTVCSATASATVLSMEVGVGGWGMGAGSLVLADM